MNKSSTFLSLLAVLAIFAVASIAINDVENSPVRKPFQASEAHIGQTDEKFSSSKRETFQRTDLKDLYEFNIDADVPPKEINLTNLNFEAEDNFGDIIKNSEKNDSKSDIEFNQPELSTSLEETIEIEIEGYKFSQENLFKAGLENTIAQKRPYDGFLFNDLELKSLTSFDLDYQVIYLIENGEQNKIFDVYSFTNIEKDLSEEIYDLIRIRYENSLGARVNETNMFGLSSFFINFTPPKENAFLVVKYPDSVYALSYPKAEAENSAENSTVDYYEIIKKLL
ncbi:hypothetical protein GF376_00985 [Candidatus Peregrinibacteria bacterium]|nr:hypothetical protein [Candidatus Peregrinibacteria bacterium]